MPNPFLLRPRSEFDTLGESSDHAQAVAVGAEFFGRACLIGSGVELGLMALWGTTDVLYPDEGMSFSAVSAGVMAVAFALGSRFGFVMRNRALLRATELPHEFSDARDAELAASAIRQGAGQGSEDVSQVIDGIPQSGHHQPVVLLNHDEAPIAQPEPGQPENPRSAE